MKSRVYSIFGGVITLHLSALVVLLGLSACRGPEVLRDRPYIPAPAPAPVIGEFPPMDDDFELAPLPPMETDIDLPPPEITVDPVSYTVVKGDSFWKIARRYGVSHQELAAYNNMSLEKPLRVGTTLQIPPGGALIPEEQLPPVKAAAKKVTREPLLGDGTYIVQSGDSLWKIAVKYNLKTSTLADANSLDIKKPLQVGQKLLIPGAGGLRPAPGPTPLQDDTMDEFTEDDFDDIPDDDIDGAIDAIVDDGAMDDGIDDMDDDTDAVLDEIIGDATTTDYFEHDALPGETVKSIAEMYGLREDAVRKANPGLPADGKVAPYSKVKIPQM